MKNITLSFILSKTSANYEEIHKTGVYKIYHLYNPSVVYIGSASSIRKWQKGFKLRWSVHLQNLKNNKHHSIYLQRIVNKYGLDDLRFEILEFCDPINCLEKEQFWLNELNPFKKKGYNTCLIAGNTLGYKFPENKKSNRKPIVQYDLNGQFIKEWSSLNNASRELNINVSSIKDCCKKRFKQIKGYIFRYKSDLEIPSKVTVRNPMIINCYFNNVFMFSGKFTEIINLVPDKKKSIYESIRKGIITRRNWKYIKKN